MDKIALSVAAHKHIIQCIVATTTSSLAQRTYRTIAIDCNLNCTMRKYIDSRWCGVNYYQTVMIENPPKKKDVYTFLSSSFHPNCRVLYGLKLVLQNWTSFSSRKVARHREQLSVVSIANGNFAVFFSVVLERPLSKIDEKK